MTGTHPHLFSPACCTIRPADAAAMQALIDAIESVIALPCWQTDALADAPEIARLPQPAQGARGVFMGYDFHLTAAGPRLIEINTNAGGALLAAGRIQAERWPQTESAGNPVPPGFAAMQAQAAAAPTCWLEMFRQEWQASHPGQPLRHVLIVDEQPLQQYLAPEFLLWQTLFAGQGIQVSIADPAALHWDGEKLYCPADANGQAPAGSCINLPVDLVYNRLTDFPLAAPAQAALRAAYLACAVVVTPHPRAHALYADKRNLVRLSDPAWLAAADVPPDVHATLLQGVPKTVPVRADAAEIFWQTRRQWFFKPADGFGSRAAYRGDKLTRRVFDSILQGNYIAQAIVPPSEYPVCVEGVPQTLKADIRNYVYAGQTQLCIARLYQGQTTNFRTPGGGFAPVRVA